ncbi:MAG TPA: plasmid pRiA4b ORF-3 family protein [Bacteroidales bacterium]|jgi:hypothetical protein|nr:MAG: Plasmid pRiA4b ORF-3-like protein [Bacteroidetes bacterium ADurb.Bin012]HNQ59722.1 plasmid pRiA4b ORF-3 family protein [Bacteroidales bacterium]HNV16902.1 plasmid pRiA4b ORF-3 family protein [Bacteroidales bacterium]HNZ79383.1 plasmid pRiA4b ORF-3 family protein [Bacteroidales bacterium]HOC15884.1 plasmid pRiA4b ORF-3 family protein [Bacteroidales bacterium]
MTFQFKIKLQRITKPSVWRRIIVPAAITFDDFHNIIQDAFGWSNSHLYAFSPLGYRSSPQIEAVPEEDEETSDSFFSLNLFFNAVNSLNAAKTKLTDIFNREGQIFTYIYDFGDDWVHKITLEKIDKLHDSSSAILLGGKGACPPEDCGGTYSFEEFKFIMADKSDPQRSELLEWLDLGPNDEWDPNDYDLVLEANFFNQIYKDKFKK